MTSTTSLVSYGAPLGARARFPEAGESTADQRPYRFTGELITKTACTHLRVKEVSITYYSRRGGAVKTAGAT
ncbi:MAG: hypothetical protein QXM12_01295 [Nitrososphaerota archaeon]